ncbi:MAG: DUF3800 domain-containing protein [Alphaproteobacteria bacterium]|nr:DUF3800 domain-containing protein [Alphaproteobacteria bacterium]
MPFLNVFHSGSPENSTEKLTRFGRRVARPSNFVVRTCLPAESSGGRFPVPSGRSGHRWGKLYKIGEVPLFVSSRATRMIQIADMIAYALRRYYENGEA